MKRVFIICFFLIPFLAFGEIKKITKTERVIVPQNQSVEQVLNYTSEKLARIAAEEAGVAISSSTTLVDGKISKDEIKMQTSAIAQKDTQLLKQETIDGITYITVQVTATVDSAELDAFLRQLMQNEALKKELEQERQAKLELEKKLQNATKEEYDSTLSKEAENIAKARIARQKQLEIEMANAKQQLIEAERRQKLEELSALQELERIEQEYKVQDAALQKKIAEEKDAAVKAEMEHQALLAELAQNALINDKTLDATANDNIEMIIIDAASVRVNFTALIKEYKTAMNANEKKMHQLYNSQLDMLIKQKYNIKEPVKGEWETTSEYNTRVKEYKNSKKSYENNRTKQIQKLENTYKEKISNSKQETTKSMITALSPLYERLVKYSKGKYPTGNTEKAVISFGERDVDNLQLPIEIKYKSKKYDFIYKFEDIQEFRTMYETRASFKAIPLFAVEAKGTTQAKSYLRGFDIVHLGNNKTMFFEVELKQDAFPEILEYEQMKNEIYVNKTVNNKSSSNEDLEDKKFKKNISDRTSTKKYSYPKKSFWLYGLNLGGGFDFNAFMMDFTTQQHWRLNRVFGVYFNVGGMFVLNNLYSNSSSGYYTDSYYSTVTGRETTASTIDYSLFFGFGLDIYFTNNFVMFVDANGGFIYDDRSKDDNYGIILKGGFAFQGESNIFGVIRASAFVENIFADTESSRTPFFGVGVQF